MYHSYCAFMPKKKKKREENYKEIVKKLKGNKKVPLKKAKEKFFSPCA